MGGHLRELLSRLGIFDLWNQIGSFDLTLSDRDLEQTISGTVPKTPWTGTT